MLPPLKPGGVAPDPLAETQAQRLDASDPLPTLRERFHIPPDPKKAGVESVYLCGNSLGLQPKATRAALLQELDDWARLGVEGHFHAAHPWLPYHEELRETAARLVGAMPREVVAMNSLTVNLHLMMVTFYRPTAERFRIVIEDAAFPSDSYAVRSQAAFHGFDLGGAGAAVVRLRPREGEHALRTDDVEEFLEREGKSIALVLLGGVNYLTGQVMDMERITAAGHRAGAVVGWDLAHAAGNVAVRLHDWEADFACWCTYKYLNSGPGAVAGCFVHERHLGGGRADRERPRFEGWWGTDPATRFKMGPEFAVGEGGATADAWQLSNPPILALAPYRVSLGVFDEVGIGNLRAKSDRLTAYLQGLIDAIPGVERAIEVITPREPGAQGAQLSLAVKDRPRDLFGALTADGVLCDFREPNVVRVAPAPLYNTFHDCWRFGEILRGHLARR